VLNSLKNLFCRHEAKKLLLPPLGFDVPKYPSDEEVHRAIHSVPTHQGATTYLIYNSSLATTAAPVKQPTGSAVRTMMLLKMGAGVYSRIIEWGCSFDGSAAATPGQVELFETTVAATMSTAFVNADIQRFGNANGPAQGDTANIPVDVTSTGTAGFATAAVTEGTVANYRGFDLQLIAPTNQYVKQWPLGREPDLKAGNFTRVRVTFGTTVNMYCYLIIEV
jgi:hypothetical protein